MPVSRVSRIRALCAVLAAIVIVDAISVAPGLVLMAVPFMIGAIGMRRGGMLASIPLALWSLLYVVVGVNYAASNGFDAGWGDLLFAYAGTPLAAVLAFVLVRHMPHRADHALTSP